MDYKVDVLVVGGGPAGLTTALTLARISRSVLVCDDHHERNIIAHQMHNFPSREGTSPEDFKKAIEKDLRRYDSVKISEVTVLEVNKMESSFFARLSDGSQVISRKVVLAHGVEDHLPPIPGVSDLWGKSVFHCPYCHGYEYRDKPLGILAAPKFAMHVVAVMKALSPDMAIFANGGDEFTDDQINLLAKNNIAFYHEKIKRLNHSKNKLQNIELENGHKVSRAALLINTCVKLKSQLGQKLGCHMKEHDTYALEHRVKTSIFGVYAAGDVSEHAHSVLLACSSGASTGFLLGEELGQEDLGVPAFQNIKNQLSA